MLLYQIIVFVLFISYVVYHHGILYSISNSTYQLKHPWLFTVFLILLAWPLVIMGGWYFASGTFLIFCGVAAEYKEKLTDVVHNVGAVGGIIFSLVGLLMDGIQFPIIIYAAFIGVVNISDIKSWLKNDTWWIEVTAFLLIATGLYVRP